MDFEYGDRIDVRGVDGFFDPDEDFRLAYDYKPANSPDGQVINDVVEILSDFGEFLPDVGEAARFVGGVMVFGVHIGENQLDETRHVAIILNGVSESTLDGDYLGNETLFGSGWIVNPDYFA